MNFTNSGKRWQMHLRSFEGILPLLRSCILLFVLVPWHADAAELMPKALTTQVEHLVLLLQQPGLVEEDESARQWKQISSYAVVSFEMDSIGGSGFRTYLALFSRIQRDLSAPYVLEGIVLLPDPHYLEMRGLDVAIKGRVLAVTLHDVSGEPPTTGKPSVWRYSIEGPDGWGLRLLPK